VEGGKMKCLSILISLIALIQPSVGSAQGDIEKNKIEFLLNQIENQKGAKFWRNGSAYSPKQAAEHLRMKWEKAGKSIKVAQDFIEKIAAKSSMSGKAYEIEFADGTKTETRIFLIKKLSEWKH
jgi:hypothetical protein